jgi:hypothetical protein
VRIPIDHRTISMNNTHASGTATIIAVIPGPSRHRPCRGGYRTGYIAATMLVLLAVLPAVRLPSSIGRDLAAKADADGSTEPAVA